MRDGLHLNGKWAGVFADKLKQTVDSVFGKLAMYIFFLEKSHNRQRTVVQRRHRRNICKLDLIKKNAGSMINKKSDLNIWIDDIIIDVHIWAGRLCDVYKENTIQQE